MDQQLLNATNPGNFAVTYIGVMAGNVSSLQMAYRMYS
jgi:hypothetical protein